MTPRTTPTQKTDVWTKFAIVQLCGCWFLGKIFAVVGGPLVALLFFNRNLCQSLYRALTRRDPLSFVSWTLLVSIMYGVCETVYGVLSGHDPVTALQILVFNFCPLYLFLGIWAGARRPGFLQGFIKFTFWYGTVYTFVYFLVLRNLSSGDDAIGHPGSGMITFLAPFCFEFSLSVFWLPILVATFNIIANQIRADWVGLAIAMTIWGVTARKLGRIFSIVGLIVGLLLIGFIFDVRIPGFAERGGEISARDTVGRAMSSIDPELAGEYSTGAATYAGTVHWRETWWKEIRDTVAQSPMTIVFGMGYGYPIADLVSYLKGMDIRTPHSILYFTLCYSGCIGVVIFFVLQTSILMLHWRTFKATGQIYGFVTHIALLTSAFFGNLFEAPQSAITLYLLLGMSIGPLFSKEYSNETTTVTPDVSTIAIPTPRRIRMRGYASVSSPAAE
jgi:hypothetical protein